MSTTTNHLRLFLRVFGLLTGLAVVAVFMPLSWMDACHRWLGLGPLPQGPIVEYLARSLSAFYVMFGMLCWLASTHVRRYATLIAFLGWGGVIFAVVVFWVDSSAGLPLHWRAAEGPIVMTFSAILLVLRRRAMRGHGPGGA